ncbi:DUF349 domain-containing protein [Pontibacter amylolyticus]|uniref:DUF349 domain-containing protein n=1 Tax=Pontibacter amylolyticus TaxID=1424080 RepID=A0ABQ1VU48_9BACT|nr:DUF349 domain-containing protein [Pontibacter amylolyticus]GGF99426.1 hypothetical protein GCM10011323_00720 [Pontibacter amylolyticus]
MTTDKQHTDANGAEANKPRPQDEAQANGQQASSPMDIVEQRLAEINAQKESAQDKPSETGVPKEDQPEINPALASEAETSETEEITEAFAEANLPEAEAPATEAATPTETTDTSSSATTTPEATEPNTPVAAADEHHDEEELDEDDHTDYSQMPLEDLRNHLTQLLKVPDAKRKYKKIQEIHRQYEDKFQIEKGQALDRFRQEGGTEEDFDYHAPVAHTELEQLYAAYREARYQDRQHSEEQRVRNLERKRELLQQLRTLVESAETKNSSDELKKLQGEWKSIGPVPPGEAQELWDSYHALLDIFYNNRSMFFEMKELDRRRNLDAKVQLIERAEALQNEPSINKALQELRHLHEEWKNIGPVPNEQRDAIWERFIQASEKVHEQRRSYMEERKTIEMANLEKKRGLLARLQEFQTFNTDRINEWRDKTDEIQKLKEEWDSAGLVPKEYAEEVNKNFWGNYKAFFQHKNQFFKGLDEQKTQNLRLKTELCEQAESLKESTDWNTTKEKMIQLQKKWKTIGRVPDKHSDKIWQRFRAACNEFFDRKQAQEQQKGAEMEKLSSEKLALCDRITEELTQPNTTTSLDDFNRIVAEWDTLDTGNKRVNTRVEERFLSLMERYLERVPDLPYDERMTIVAQLQVDRLKNSPDASQKLYQKEQTIRREIGQLQNDIQTLRTNLDFFARSKNADKLREEYEGRIEDTQKRIDILQRQLAAFRR